jgi:hypothetical protein
MAPISSRCLRSAFALVAVALACASCRSVEKGLKKVVFIEYDQAINFDKYTFGGAFNLPPDGGTVNLVTLVSNQLENREIWMLYEICLITNEGSKAKDFQLDIGKFYVEYGGKKHKAGPLRAYHYEHNAQPSSLGADADTTVISDHFLDETRLGNDQQTIPAGDTDSSARRFVIQVVAPAGDTSDLYQTRLKLRYDAPGVVLGDRGWGPDGPHEIGPGNLPVTCRAQKHSDT